MSGIPVKSPQAPCGWVLLCSFHAHGHAGSEGPSGFLGPHSCKVQSWPGPPPRPPACHSSAAGEGGAGPEGSVSVAALTGRPARPRSSHREASSPQMEVSAGPAPGGSGRRLRAFFSFWRHLCPLARPLLLSRASSSLCLPSASISTCPRLRASRLPPRRTLGHCPPITQDDPPLTPIGRVPSPCLVTRSRVLGSRTWTSLGSTVHPHSCPAPQRPC